MSSCEKFCILCESDQNAKVNFTMEHGLCPNHCKYNEEFLECIHCKIIVPICLITILTPAYSESNTLKTASNSLNLGSLNYTPFSNSEPKEKCEYCIQEKEVTTLKCSHKMCKDCLAEKCQLCSIRDSFNLLENPCQFCEVKPGEIKLNCGHLICEGCSGKQCGLCEIYSRNQSICEPALENCDYCLQQLPSIQCKQGHNICVNCYKNQCPECYKTLSVHNNLCGVCKVSKFYSVCKSGHRVCENCYDKCSLCDLLANHSSFEASQELIKRKSSENVRKCEYCKKEPGNFGNFCSHFFCKNCIYQHKKECSVNSISISSGSVSILSESSGSADEESKVEPKIEESFNSSQRPQSKYELSKELTQSNRSSKAIKSTGKQCKKCQVF